MTKEEQLKQVFKHTLENWGYWVDDSGRIIEKRLDEEVSVLLKEVTIRTKL